MRLIDAPIGIFRFDGELVLKTEYYSENKRSGKYIPDCYIVRTGEYFLGGTKTANELINLDVEPVDFAELLSTVTDTISRQDAIDAMKTWDWQELYLPIHFKQLLDDVPSVDAVEVVRCGECKNRFKVICPFSYKYAIDGSETDFCSYGERRTDG